MSDSSPARDQAVALMHRFYSLFAGDLAVLDEVVADGWRKTSSNGTYNEKAPCDTLPGKRQYQAITALTVTKLAWRAPA